MTQTGVRSEEVDVAWTMAATKAWAGCRSEAIDENIPTMTMRRTAGVSTGMKRMENDVRQPGVRCPVEVAVDQIQEREEVVRGKTDGKILNQTSMSLTGGPMPRQKAVETWHLDLARKHQGGKEMTTTVTAMMTMMIEEANGRINDGKAAKILTMNLMTGDLRSHPRTVV